MVLANLACLTHGACAIYPSEGFEPDAALKAVQDEQASAFIWCPNNVYCRTCIAKF